ncbi:hypothetical protein J6590_062572 [Homalodisca vitripennis]|nr:hypothetical protein J6590_062572 [Homalodisca vitripennis]
MTRISCWKAVIGSRQPRESPKRASSAKRCAVGKHQIFNKKKDHARCLPAAQRFALLALLEKKLTRVVPNLKPRSHEQIQKNTRMSMKQWFRKIYADNGVRGLFTGLTPRLLKTAPSCAIMVSTFEYGKSYFEQYNVKKYMSQIKSDS